jgi:hypothetical protein
MSLASPFRRAVEIGRTGLVSAGHGLNAAFDKASGITALKKRGLSLSKPEEARSVKGGLLGLPAIPIVFALAFPVVGFAALPLTLSISSAVAFIGIVAKTRAISNAKIRKDKKQKAEPKKLQKAGPL